MAETLSSCSSLTIMKQLLLCLGDATLASGCSMGTETAAEPLGRAPAPFLLGEPLPPFSWLCEPFLRAQRLPAAARG